MHRDSFASYRPPVQPSGSRKSTQCTRSPIRSTPVQTPIRNNSRRYVEVRINQKCPNCEESFPSAQYNSHFILCCFKSKTEHHTRKSTMSKINRNESFRISKAKGKREETVHKRQTEPEVDRLIEGEKAIGRKEKRQIEKVEQREQFGIDNPEIGGGRETTEVAGQEANEMHNGRDIQEIRNALQEEEITRPTRKNNRPATPYPQQLLQLQHILRNCHRQNRNLSSDSLLAKIHPPNHNKEHAEVCAICLNEFVGFQRTITLKCKHEFHMSCIAKWLQKRLNCPICRAHQK